MPSIKAKYLLDKVRFIEWLSTNPGMSRADLAVAIRIVSAYNEKRGYAFPGLERIAADVGITKRQAIRSVQFLEQSGFITVKHSIGRGNANEYKPFFDRIPDGDLYALENGDKCVTNSNLGGSVEKVTFRAEKVTENALKGDSQVTPTVLTAFKKNRSSPDASYGVNADSYWTPDMEDSKLCAIAERALRNNTLTAPEKEELTKHLERISLEYGYGDKLQGWAQRLLESTW